MAKVGDSSLLSRTVWRLQAACHYRRPPDLETTTATTIPIYFPVKESQGSFRCGISLLFGAVNSTAPWKFGSLFEPAPHRPMYRKTVPNRTVGRATASICTLGLTTPETHTKPHRRFYECCTLHQTAPQNTENHRTALQGSQHLETRTEPHVGFTISENRTRTGP